MFVKDQLFTVTVTDMNNEGNGICRVDGMVVFVIGGVTGDVCVIKLIKVTKSYCVAMIDELKLPSPHRRDRFCSVKRCGGCVFKCIDREYELQIKKRTVEGAFLKNGINIPVADVCAASSCERYRNKAQFPVGYDKSGNMRFGYYASRTHDIIPCDDCNITKREFSGIASAVCKIFDKYGVSAYDEKSSRGMLRHICMRRGISGISLVLVINADRIDNCDKIVKEIIKVDKDITGISLNINKNDTNVIYGNKYVTVYGDPNVYDRLCGREFIISPASFYQVNHDCCEALYNKVSELLDIGGDEVAVDLYCGVGTVGMCAASSAKRLIGIEIVPEAIENAKKNAEKNNLKNAEFYCGDSSLIKNKLDITPDAVIVDPPRKGLSDDVINSLTELMPKRILYISCDPDTLARDLKKMLDFYKADAAYPFDMFPRTGHVETVVLLSRK